MGPTILFPEDNYMSVKIRLKRFGSKMRPFYRIVVMDSRQPRDGRTIEEIGLYHPIESEDKQIVIDEAKVKSWLAKGAEPSDTVRGLLNRKNIQIVRK
jgi:small subunit ribosomal protein S16